ncbi:MAG TPA: IS1634 family transposase [Prolixibacteraceae bacterium]|nr:IS1634 family transposase [Prolixibacteraceae bacterium]
MFIREKSKTVKGKKYIQHQLIESIRTPAGPRQQLVLNLGFLDLHPDKWKELANTIESEVHKQPRLFVTDPQIEKLARHYAKVIIREKLNKESERAASDKTADRLSADYQSVDVNSVSSSEARKIGAEHVVLAQMSEYKFDKMLKELGFTENQLNYAKILIAGRLVNPSSERETARWANEDSAILELLQAKINVYDTALHRTAVLLWEHHDKIEQRLSQAAREIFGLKETIILYDLTNTYFEGSKKGSKIANHAKSKDKRDDRPLITLALTLDAQGFPKQSKVYEGNISEPGTLEKMLDELSNVVDGFNSQKTIVIDAGIATEDNLQIIKRKQFKYLAVSRKKSYGDDFWQGSQEQQIKLSDKKTRLRVKLVKTKKESYLLCYSEAKEAKEKAILDRRLKKFEEGLNGIDKGLKKKRTHKKYDKIIERIGRLKEKYGVGSLYDIEVKQQKGVATKIIFNKNPNGKAKEKRVGEYVIRTNRLDLIEEEISKIHRTLTTVEDSFRSMKSELGLRPNYHKRDDTGTAHIFITVIAYHIIAGILKKLRANAINYSWRTIRNILSTQVRVTTSFNTEDKATMHIRTTTTPTLKQSDIYSKLGLVQKPLKQVKIKLPLKKDRTTTNK